MDATEAMNTTSPREEGLLGEALALVQATANDADLNARAVKVLSDIEQAATNAFYAFKLYVPAAVPGSLAGEVDAIDAELVKRLGFDPLDLRVSKPSSGGAFAESLDYASGAAGVAAAAGARNAGDTLSTIGDGLVKYLRYIGIALVVLLLAFAAYEVSRVVKEA